MRKERMFFNLEPTVFHQLTNYMVGNVEETEDVVVIRFDKKIEGAIVAREILINDDGMHFSNEYLLDTCDE